MSALIRRLVAMLGRLGFVVAVEGDAGDGAVSSREATLSVEGGAAVDGEAVRRTLRVRVSVPRRGGLEGLLEAVDAVDEVVRAVAAVSREAVGAGRIRVASVEYAREADRMGGVVAVEILA